ncbi:MAG: chromosome partitioning protein ParA, partial [Muribaculaceae bacterium]|nr:chromosome partitioning protein ParA [Muribaculaceae bacterium]
MAEEYYNSKEVRKDEDFAKVQDWLYYCLSKWYWFVIALAITFAIAVFYILKTQPTYTRVASILIKEDNNSSLSNEFSSFSDFGVTKNNTNLYNEMITLKSPTYMKQVVKELHLDMNYSIKGPFHEDVLYDKTLPINVTMADVQEDDAATLTVTLKKDNEVILSDFVLDKEEIEHAPISAKLNTLVSTPIGKVTVTPTQYFEGIYDDPIKVRHIGTEAATGKYVGRLEIELNNDKASVVDLKLEDESTKRAEDILNMLYEIYNKNWVKDINEQAESTSKFIDKELLTIQGELGDVDENISNYKSEHYVPDIQLASNINMHKVEQTNSLILDLKNQLFMANYIKKQLGNSGDFKVLPANSGIDNSSVAEQIKMYNQNVMRRNNLVANSNENNPLVADLDESLTATRQAIHASIDNTIATLNARIADLQGSKAETRQQIASNPNQEKYLLSVERQQKVKEQLYLFLLQKREENELSKAYTAYNTKMLNPPAGTNSPTKPVKMNVMIVAFALGLLLPMLVLFVLYNMDTKVHSRRDLDSLSLPFVGEIPLSYRKRKGIMSLFNKKKEVREIVVQEKAHNSINEAFRVVRTNLEFISGKDEG